MFCLPISTFMYPVSDLYIPSQLGRPILGIYKSLIDELEQEEEQLQQTEAEEESCSLEQSEVASSSIVANTFRTTLDI